ncbi:MAG TPA: potassium transporter TrkA [Thermoanaerobaculia bacterium]|nr:potassium transporter TrkA [Thermoanaerobaculia bacterium]
MRDFTLRQRLRYAFDNTLSRGTPALIAWLAIVSVAFLVLTAAALIVTGAAPKADNGAALSFPELMWHNLMRTLDSGTMGGDTGSTAYLLITLCVTLGGVFIVGTLIGLISNGVGNQIEELRKGRSVVAEKDHIVILGWNDQIYSIIGELILGNENRKRNCIVIMADRDKVGMEDEVRERIDDFKTTRIVCRRGSPIDLGDLHIVNFNGARAIIILSPPGSDADSEVIKSILAITNHPQRRTEKFHIVAEIRESKNMEPARLVGRDEAQLIETGDVMARVIAQTCRQTGLSTVYTELLDYGGDEIYFKDEPSLTGMSFADALFSFETSALVGVKTKDGVVRLNPPMDEKFAPGDQAIVIAKDLESVQVSRTKPAVDPSLMVPRGASTAAAEKTLVVGWNSRAPIIIRELDGYVAPGSLLTILADAPDLEAQVEAVKANAKRQIVELRRGDTTDRATLESVNPEQYQHIIVLCYSDDLDVQKADAKTLVTLLHLRDLEVKSGANRYAIVTEMLDSRNRELAEITQVDDFIVSEKLTSLLVAQITENKDLQAVFTDIFDADGSEIYLKPASDYVKLGAPVSYWHVVDAARSRGEVAIGYRLAARSNDVSQGYGVSVNPPKGNAVTFAPDDRVIVIAED